MNIKGFLVGVSIFLLSGCAATVLTYQPKEYSGIQESIDVLKDCVRYQLPKFVPKEIHVTPEFIQFIDNRYQTKYIVLDKIANIQLYEKRDWIMVSVVDSNQVIMYRFYVSEERMDIAQQFINALYTLKNHRKNEGVDFPSKSYSGLISTLYGTGTGNTKIETDELSESEKLKKLEDIENFIKLNDIPNKSEKLKKIAAMKVLVQQKKGSSTSDPKKRLEMLRSLGLLTQNEFEVLKAYLQ